VLYCVLCAFSPVLWRVHCYGTVTILYCTVTQKCKSVLSPSVLRLYWWLYSVLWLYCCVTVSQNLENLLLPYCDCTVAVLWLYCSVTVSQNLEHLLLPNSDCDCIATVLCVYCDCTVHLLLLCRYTVHLLWEYRHLWGASGHPSEYAYIHTLSVEW